MIDVFCDFDGTLTNKDTLVVLLDKYTSSDWYAFEERVLAGEIDERECLRSQLALLTVPDVTLMETIQEEIHPAEGLSELVLFIKGRGWQMHVLSGGLIRFSGELWRQWGYSDIPLYANDHDRDEAGRIRVIPANTPRIKELCNHCKRWHLDTAKKCGSLIVYIGDGMTDFCASEAAHIRYAKRNLQHISLRYSSLFRRFIFIVLTCSD